jgi:hypothetical protein
MAAEDDEEVSAMDEGESGESGVAGGGWESGVAGGDRSESGTSSIIEEVSSSPP